MAKKSEKRLLIGLICQVCKKHNYTTEKNKINTPEKLVIKKYCQRCRKRTDHKETEKLK